MGRHRSPSSGRGFYCVSVHRKRTDSQIDHEVDFQVPALNADTTTAPHGAAFDQRRILSDGWLGEPMTGPTPSMVSRPGIPPNGFLSIAAG